LRSISDFCFKFDLTGMLRLSFNFSFRHGIG